MCLMNAEGVNCWEAILCCNLLRRWSSVSATVTKTAKRVDVDQTGIHCSAATKSCIILLQDKVIGKTGCERICKTRGLSVVALKTGRPWGKLGIGRIVHLMQELCQFWPLFANCQPSWYLHSQNLIFHQPNRISFGAVAHTSRLGPILACPHGTIQCHSVPHPESCGDDAPARQSPKYLSLMQLRNIFALPHPLSLPHKGIYNSPNYAHSKDVAPIASRQAGILFKLRTSPVIRAISSKTARPERVPPQRHRGGPILVSLLECLVMNSHPSPCQRLRLQFALSAVNCLYSSLYRLT
jgi:hypothetical protein